MKFVKKRMLSSHGRPVIKIASKPENNTRRSSILKVSKGKHGQSFPSRENSPPKVKRRVSFAGKKHIKEFSASNEQGTVWNSTYSESDTSQVKNSQTSISDESQSTIDTQILVESSVENQENEPFRSLFPAINQYSESAAEALQAVLHPVNSEDFFQVVDNDRNLQILRKNLSETFVPTSSPIGPDFMTDKENISLAMEPEKIESSLIEEDIIITARKTAENTKNSSFRFSVFCDDETHENPKNDKIVTDHTIIEEQSMECTLASSPIELSPTNKAEKDKLPVNQADEKNVDNQAELSYQSRKEITEIVSSDLDRKTSIDGNFNRSIMDMTEAIPSILTKERMSQKFPKTGIKMPEVIPSILNRLKNVDHARAFDQSGMEMTQVIPSVLNRKKNIPQQESFINHSQMEMTQAIPSVFNRQRKISQQESFINHSRMDMTEAIPSLINRQKIINESTQLGNISGMEMTKAIPSVLLPQPRGSILETPSQSEITHNYFMELTENLGELRKQNYNPILLQQKLRDSVLQSPTKKSQLSILQTQPSEKDRLALHRLLHDDLPQTETELATAASFHSSSQENHQNLEALKIAENAVNLKRVSLELTETIPLTSTIYPDARINPVQSIAVIPDRPLEILPHIEPKETTLSPDSCDSLEESQSPSGNSVETSPVAPNNSDMNRKVAIPSQENPRFSTPDQLDYELTAKIVSKKPIVLSSNLKDDETTRVILINPPSLSLSSNDNELEVEKPIALPPNLKDDETTRVILINPPSLSLSNNDNQLEVEKSIAVPSSSKDDETTRVILINPPSLSLSNNDNETEVDQQNNPSLRQSETLQDSLDKMQANLCSYEDLEQIEQPSFILSDSIELPEISITKPITENLQAKKDPPTIVPTMKAKEVKRIVSNQSQLMNNTIKKNIEITSHIIKKQNQNMELKTKCNTLDKIPPGKSKINFSMNYIRSELDSTKRRADNIIQEKSKRFKSSISETSRNKIKPLPDLVFKDFRKLKHFENKTTKDNFFEEKNTKISNDQKNAILANDLLVKSLEMKIQSKKAKAIKKLEVANTNSQSIESQFESEHVVNTSEISKNSDTSPKCSFDNLKDNLESFEKNEDCTWKIIKIDEKMICIEYYKTSLTLAIIFDVPQDPNDIEKINRIRIVPRLSEKEKPMLRITDRLITAKINVENLKKTYKTYDNVVQLIQHVTDEVKFVFDFYYELQKLEKQNLMDIFVDKVSFIAQSKKMQIILKVWVNIKPFSEITSEDIQVECLVGSIKTSDIQALVRNVKKNYNFLTFYINDVRDFVDLMEESMAPRSKRYNMSERRKRYFKK